MMFNLVEVGFNLDSVLLCKLIFELNIDGIVFDNK